MFTDLRPIDVFVAAKRLRGIARATELRRSAPLSELAGGDVWLKLENEQVTGSFKVRGAFNAIAALDPDVRARGVVASSAGNHGLGVAFAARHFGIPATIFVPRTAPEVKRRGIEALGATVNAAEPHYDAALARARRAAEETGRTFVHPCLGAALLAGQGTVGLEIIEALPELATVVVPVGGAGLLGGIASLLRAVAPHVRIVGTQSELTDAMARSVRANEVVPIESRPTLADGLAGDIDDAALDIGRHALDDIVTVSEEELGDAIAWLARTEGLVVEGAGAVGVAAVRQGRLGELAFPVAVVLSGRNIDRERHERVLRESSATEAVT